jgi:hypothetical protein
MKEREREALDEDSVEWMDSWSLPFVREEDMEALGRWW